MSVIRGIRPGMTRTPGCIVAVRVFFDQLHHSVMAPGEEQGLERGTGRRRCEELICAVRAAP